MKYLISTEVHAFRFEGKRYLAGETLEIPEGKHIPPFLIPVKRERKHEPVSEVAPEPESIMTDEPKQRATVTPLNELDRAPLPQPVRPRRKQ